MVMSWTMGSVRAYVGCRAWFAAIGNIWGFVLVPKGVRSDSVHKEVFCATQHPVTDNAARVYRHQRTIMASQF
ncbi:hypothetical protein B0J13DRAFT_538398 [Dactylonectria estremocensis]|uniref:Uncharacterized protein n=1 Tax=Dactylonectria estremocensis TaxID=1079267 RepID=A0A9P9JIZ5_9HYPO|nr:hypothetical protein B0J13DRAFT_538398 [Dactylonectria estremocensis]